MTITLKVIYPPGDARKEEEYILHNVPPRAEKRAVWQLIDAFERKHDVIVPELVRRYIHGSLCIAPGEWRLPPPPPQGWADEAGALPVLIPARFDFDSVISLSMQRGGVA